MYVTLYSFREICVKNVGFLILNSFKILVRFSKYDFWIPEQILDFIILFSKKWNFFRDRKIFRKSSKTYFPGPKKSGFFRGKSLKSHENLQNQNFDFSEKKQNFGFSLTFHSKIIFRTFPIFFRSWKIFEMFLKKYYKIQNLLRNPKIILRKSYEHSKWV